MLCTANATYQAALKISGAENFVEKCFKEEYIMLLSLNIFYPYLYEPGQSTSDRSYFGDGKPRAFVWVFNYAKVLPPKTAVKLPDYRIAYYYIILEKSKISLHVYRRCLEALKFDVL